MKKYFVLLFLVIFFTNNVLAAPVKEKTFKVNKNKNFNMIEKSSPAPKNAVAQTTPGSNELIPVNVKNEFDDEIRVKLDTNREYPVGPHEWITLGKRKPGRYTLTIYNKHGDFVDNLTRNIDNKNKFVLNKNTISNSNKIDNLSTGQKVGITAGAIGAAALTGIIANKLLKGDEQEEQQQAYVPPVVQGNTQGVAVETYSQAKVINAFAIGGKPFKILNAAYPKITVIVEGTDGKPIGDNWVIPKAALIDKPQPLVYDGQNITIDSKQKVQIILPDGTELQRIAFELDAGVDGYVWIVK